MQASKAGWVDCYLGAGEPILGAGKPVSGAVEAVFSEPGGAGFHWYINARRSAFHGQHSPEESTDSKKPRSGKTRKIHKYNAGVKR